MLDVAQNLGDVLITRTFPLDTAYVLLSPSSDVLFIETFSLRCNRPIAMLSKYQALSSKYSGAMDQILNLTGHVASAHAQSTLPLFCILNGTDPTWPI